MNTLFDSKKVQKKKPQPKQYVNQFEVLKDTVNSAPKAASQELKTSANAFWEQLLGVDKNKSQGKKQGGELRPGQSLNLKDAPDKQQESKPNITAAMSYENDIMRSSETNLQKENTELKQTIQQLLTELHQAAAANKKDSNLQEQIDQAIGTGVVTKPGKYYTAFFQHIFGILKDARKRASGAEVWRSAVKGKGKKGIHKMMKSNMQVGMSGERAVASSTG